MATTAPPGRMTADDFIADRSVPERAELVRGELRVMTPAFNDHTLVCLCVFRALDAFVRARGLGEVLPDGFAYRLPHRDDTVRIPDVSFVRAGRLPNPMPRRGILQLAPDLAVEVLSGSDTPAVLRKKVADYLDAGAALLWVVDPDERGVEVWVRGEPPRWVPEGETLDGGSLLPDFSVPVADFFAAIERDG